MRPDEGYRKPRKLLQQHDGDELGIAIAYMKKALEWPQVKSEDRKALNVYALFLIGCRNTMNDRVHGGDEQMEQYEDWHLKTIL